MPDLTFLLVTLVLATHEPLAVRDTPGGRPAFDTGARLSEDPVERAYQQLLERDDAAQAEIDGWIREADAQGAAADTEALERRIEERMRGVEAAYREFLGAHPGHVRARVAYGSFLNDTDQEARAQEEWEQALRLDPKNPAIYNNLAGIYAHVGPVTNAFTYFEKAIELAPGEPTYHENLATLVFLYRRDVMEHYGITDEQQVFDKALGLYQKAMALDPGNFILAAELARTYYGIRPPRHEDALAAWRRAYAMASDDLEREGVRVHLVRVQVQAGRFDEARTNLLLITNANYSVVKERLVKTLEAKERAGTGPDGGTPPTTGRSRE